MSDLFLLKTFNNFVSRPGSQFGLDHECGPTGNRSAPVGNAGVKGLRVKPKAATFSSNTKCQYLSIKKIQNAPVGYFYPSRVTCCTRGINNVGEIFFLNCDRLKLTIQRLSRALQSLDALKTRQRWILGHHQTRLTIPEHEL